ncbi:MAG: hypothetical protein BRD55_03815 [Bacteroidetes bacterium SW_9_63_38]|nr:MAG: hypothetical protein BRD55_03815 [Bacteroidetes bacterium SW_9_63_38]
MRWRGAIGSLEIRDRRKRTGPFLVSLGAAGLALGVVGLLNVHGQGLLAALLGCHLINTMLLMGITRWWKISIHCASAAGALGTLVFLHTQVPGTLLGTAGWGRLILSVGAVLVPLLLWARVRSRAHTAAQATAGTVLGLVAPYAELYAVLSLVGLS